MGATVKILDLSNDRGYWAATLYLPIPPDGQSVEVDKRYGSWRITPQDGDRGHRDVLPVFAAALQREVRRRERNVPSASQ